MFGVCSWCARVCMWMHFRYMSPVCKFVPHHLRALVLSQSTVGGFGLTTRIVAMISLGVFAFHANTERFQGLVPLLPHLCPLSVPKGGGT